MSAPFTGRSSLWLYAVFRNKARPWRDGHLDSVIANLLGVGQGSRENKAVRSGATEVNPQIYLQTTVQLAMFYQDGADRVCRLQINKGEQLPGYVLLYKGDAAGGLSIYRFLRFVHALDEENQGMRGNCHAISNLWFTDSHS